MFPQGHGRTLGGKLFNISEPQFRSLKSEGKYYASLPRLLRWLNELSGCKSLEEVSGVKQMHGNY